MRRVVPLLAALALCAGTATGSPVQATTDSTASWLTRTLGVEVPARVAVVTPDLAYPSSAAEVWSTEPGQYRIRPHVAARAGHADHEWRTRSLHVITHELLHRTETIPCWRPAYGALSAEEGITDALAVDLLPALAWQTYGTRATFAPKYPAEVAAIRAASALATGSGTWRARDARLWRRDLWRQDCAGRERMLAAAEGMR